METRTGAKKRKKLDTMRNQSNDVEDLDSEPKKRKKLDTMRNQSNVEDLDSEPEPPTEFFFKHNCYKTSSPLHSPYSQENVHNELINVLTEEELDWFIYHPQFKHIWHMYREANRKFNPMWMLLLRTVFIEKEKVCWFVVNGVPIRYSIREHGLLCGLNCSSYPPNHLRLGSDEFFKRNFGDVEKKTVMIKDVKEKLASDCFVVAEDRLKMAVLLFLSVIIKRKDRAGTIDDFLFRIVDDLSECERFPWGRYTFIDTINNISRLIQWFKGHVKKDWTFPGFVDPLEIMACECIPELKGCYRDDVPDANPNCPRMCKTKWKRYGMKGYPLEVINKALGDTKEIHSILDPRLEEKRLLDEIFDGEEELLYSTNPVARSWEKSLIENKKIFWEELYQQDISSRSSNAPVLQHQEQKKRTRPLKLCDDQDQLMRAMEASVKKLETKIMTRLSNLETEVRTVRTKVSNLEIEFRTSRERNASEFNGFCENGNEHAADRFGGGGGGDENTKECEDEVWADTSVTDRITSDAAEGQSRNDSGPCGIGLDGTVREQQSDTNGISRTEEVMPAASDQVVTTPFDNPNSRSVREERLDTDGIRHTGEELQNKHTELREVELLQNNTVESSEVEILEENPNRYEERPVEVDECLQAQQEQAEQDFNRLQASLEPLGASFQECISTKESMMKLIEEKHHDNAASVFCCLYRKAPPPQSFFLSKKIGFFGVVALLGSVACMPLSRVLSNYLGKDKMLSLVCKSSQSGLKGDEYRKLQSEAASLGRSITDPLKVIRLDAARRWRYGFVNNNPQKRLAMDKPYLPNGDPIPGFKGYAVNMIDLASEDLHIQSSSGHGLRETLFYDVFGELQVYETAEHLEAALPYINGKDAVSLDGVIVTGSSFIYPGSCAPEVHFPITEKVVVDLEISEDTKIKTEKMVTEETCSSHKLVKKLKKVTEE